jgi:hypothetical protein
MPLSAKTVIALLVFLTLWVAWCFFAVGKLTPLVELHLAMWSWLVAWVLCLLPLCAFAAALLVRARKNRL